MDRETLPHVGQNIAEALDAVDRQNEQGTWVPACGGTETPFRMRGYRLLYVWQRATGRHAYLNVETDMLLSDAEVDELFNR